MLCRNAYPVKDIPRYTKERKDMDLESRVMDALADYAPQLCWAKLMRQAVYDDPNTNSQAKAAVDKACEELVVLLVAGLLPEEYEQGDDRALIRSLPNYSRISDQFKGPLNLLGLLGGLAAAYAYSNWGTLPWRKVSRILLDQEAGLR